MSAIYESGILEIQKYYYSQYVLKHDMKVILKRYKIFSITQAETALKKWIAFSCFKLYKEVCSFDDITRNSTLEPTGVKVSDITIVWITFFSLLSLSTVLLAVEIFKFRLKPKELIQRINNYIRTKVLFRNSRL